MPLPWGIQAGLQAAAGLTGFIGQERTNAANAQMAQRQMDFQKNMRATQYQTAVEDMRKAGLNPALAYNQGGAGTPTGASATMNNSAAQAMQSAQAAANIAATMAQAEKTQAETAQTQQATGLEGQRASYEFFRLARENRWLAAIMGEMDESGKGMDEHPWIQRSLRLREMLASIDRNVTGSRQANSVSILNELLQNEARANSKAWGTWYGQNVRPYGNEAASVRDILTEGVRIRRGGQTRTIDRETTYERDAQGRSTGNVFTRERRY